MDHRSWLLRWAVVVLVALAASLVVKGWLLQSFYIPSASMTPTLQVDDSVLVNKLAYQGSLPRRGDVVVFESPEHFDDVGADHLIKRVIGIPGDSVAFENGSVFINQELQNEAYLPEDSFTSASSYPVECTSQHPCEIPDAMVWVMGDNRSSSRDSRFFGPVPIDLVVGQAVAVVWPMDRVGSLPSH